MADSPKIFEADCVCTKHLSLVDDQGRERASLSTGTKENDYVVFHMKDREGRPRVSIQLNASGSHIMLFTENNAPAISIGLNGDIGNGISIGHPGDGAPQIHLGVPGEAGFDHFGKEPSLIITSSQGEHVVIAPKEN
jgi:hypothetical protein